MKKIKIKSFSNVRFKFASDAKISRLCKNFSKEYNMGRGS